MATLWFRTEKKDFYTYFTTFEEAYFFGKNFFHKPTTYINIINILLTHNIAFIGIDHFELIIYYGHHEPLLNIPYKNLVFIPKEELHKMIKFV